MWFAFVAAGAASTAVIITSLWEKFQTSPTITGLDTDFHSWDVPFPALTLCERSTEPGNSTRAIDLGARMAGDADAVYYATFLAELAELSYDTLDKFEPYTRDKRLEALNAVSLKRLAFEVVARCEEVLDGCFWKGEEYSCCAGVGAFQPVFTEVGFCYTFNGREHERGWPVTRGGKRKRRNVGDVIRYLQSTTAPDSSPQDEQLELKYIEETDEKWSFAFDSPNSMLLVYIHNSMEVPTTDSGPQHEWDRRVNRISFSVKHTYTTSDARQLSIRQRRCVFEDEIRLKVDRTKYTYTACTRECRMETSTKLCGCIPHFYPAIDGFKHCNLKELGCIISNLATIKNEQPCGCELGCSNTVYEVEKLDEKSESGTSLEVEFVSWPMVRYKREVLFGWVDLLVSFGGIAGLFLGFSLLSGIEIIYYFTIRAFCMVYAERPELESMIAQQSTRRSTVKKVEPALAHQKVQKLWQPDYQGGQTLRRLNRVEPMYPRKMKRWTKGDIMVPPFGIEFLN